MRAVGPLAQSHKVRIPMGLRTSIGDRLRFRITRPTALQSVCTRPLFIMRLDVKPIVTLGTTPGLFRRLGIVPSGEFAGERLSGNVLDGSNDWQAVRADGSTSLDVRLTLQTSDGTPFLMSYRGLRYGDAEVIRQLEQGEEVDPASY